MTLFGADVQRAQLERVSYLPEERGLYKSRRVLDVLIYLGQLKGLSRRDARARGRRWLARVGLSRVEGQRVETLSKGMGQKVQIAGALLSEPELCVLDEPFSGLDPVNVALVKELIAERRAAGLATILSTHRMSQVEALCDRVAVISRGRRVAYGPLDEVRRVHSRREVRVRFAAAVEVPRVEALPAVSRARAEAEREATLQLDPAAAPHEALAQLVSAGLPVERFEPVLASMERIFLELVGAPEDDPAEDAA